MNTALSKGKAAAPRSLLQVIRDPQLYMLLQALLQDGVSRLVFPGALEHFTYRDDGDEVLATTENLDALCAAIANAVGRKSVKPKPTRVRGREGEITLVLSNAVKGQVLREVIALLAHVAAADLAALPPVDQPKGVQ